MVDALDNLVKKNPRGREDPTQVQAMKALIR